MTMAWQMYRARPRRHTYFHHICHTEHNRHDVRKKTKFVFYTAMKLSKINELNA